MATFTERIRILLDVDGTNATGNLKKFSTSVKEAEGVSGKFKAGWASASQSIQANVGRLAVGAGAALVAFGIKAASVFTGLAKASIDLGKATGFSTEQASRWIEVAGDYGVTADQLATSVGRINKDLDSAKWEKYGIATRDAAGRARDSNAIFLDVLGVLNSTTDGAERGRIGAELLGRGWQGIVPILGKSRVEYEKMLGAVKSGQVITDKEAKSAEEARLALDELGDSVEDLTLKAGGALAPALTTVVDGLNDIIGVGEGAADVISDIGDVIDKVNPGHMLERLIPGPWQINRGIQDIKAIGNAIGNLFGGGDGGQKKEIEETAQAYDDYANGVSSAMQRTANATIEAARATHDAAIETKAYSDYLADLTDAAFKAAGGLYDYDKAALDTADSVADLHAEEAAAAAVLARTATADEKAAALRKLNEQQIATAETAYAQAAAFAEAQGATEGSRVEAGLMIDKLEDLKAQFPELSALIQGYIDKLNKIPRTVETHLSLYGGGSVGTGTGGRRAGGGPVMAGVPYTVGERGQETFVPSTNGTIVPHGAGGAVYNITVTAGLGTDGALVGRQIVDAIQKATDDGYQRPWLAGVS